MRARLMVVFVLGVLACNLRAQTAVQSQRSSPSAQSSKHSSTAGTHVQPTISAEVASAPSDSKKPPQSESISERQPGGSYVGPTTDPETAAVIRANLSAEPGSQPGASYGYPSSGQPGGGSQPGAYSGLGQPAPVSTYAEPRHSGSQPGAYYPGTGQSAPASTYTGPQHSGSQPGGGSQSGAYYPGTGQSAPASAYTGPQHSGSQPGGGSQPGAYYPGTSQPAQASTYAKPQQPGSQPGGGTQPGAYYSGSAQSPQVNTSTEPQQPGSQPGGGSQPGASYTGSIQSPQVSTSTEAQQPGSQPAGVSQPGVSYSGVSQQAQINTSTSTQETKSGTDSSSKLLPAPSEPLAIYNTTIPAQPATGSSVTTSTQPPVFGMVNAPTKVSTITSESTVPLSGAAAKASPYSLPQSAPQKVPANAIGALSVIGTPTSSTISGPDGRYYITSSHPPDADSSGIGGSCVVYATGLFNQESSTDKKFTTPVASAAQIMVAAKDSGFITTSDPNANIPVGSMIVWTDKPANTTASANGYEFGDGHVGVVTAVSGNNLTITDSNWHEDNKIQTFTISKTDLNIASRPTSNPNDNDYYEFAGFVLPTPSSASTTSP